MPVCLSGSSWWKSNNWLRAVDSHYQLFQSNSFRVETLHIGSAAWELYCPSFSPFQSPLIGSAAVTCSQSQELRDGQVEKRSKASVLHWRWRLVDKWSTGNLHWSCLNSADFWWTPVVLPCRAMTVTPPPSSLMTMAALAAAAAAVAVEVARRQRPDPSCLSVSSSFDTWFHSKVVSSTFGL